MRGDASPGIEATEGYLPGSVEAADATVDSILQRIRDVPEYIQLFRDAFAVDPAATPQPVFGSGGT